MIALYPGAFKPPHRGHFNVVKSLLDGSYKGTVYNKDDYKEKASDLFKGEFKDKPNIDKVVIFIGGGERNGITKAEATAIWEMYSQHLGNVEIVDGQKNPMFAAKDYARANEKDSFVAITGLRGEEDFVDLKRVTTFNNVDNVEGLALQAAPGSGVRATDFRKSILSGNLDKIIDFFPEELSREEILNILNDLKDKIVAEIISNNISSFVTEYFTEDISEDSGRNRLSTEPILPSKDKAHLITLYNRIQNQIGSEGINIVYNNDHIKISLKNQDDKVGFDYTPFMGSILEYMLDQKMNITPLPEIKIRKDLAESESFFGKTAHYDPASKEVVLYVQGRHPKDVMRSFSHEMVHHIQNLENRLGSIATTDTNEDDNLLELEKEAYLVGNITFRNWEDSIKNSNK